MVARIEFWIDQGCFPLHLTRPAQVTRVPFDFKEDVFPEPLRPFVPYRYTQTPSTFWGRGGVFMRGIALMVRTPFLLHGGCCDCDWLEGPAEVVARARGHGGEAITTVTFM